jgi:hypothetical protein
MSNQSGALDQPGLAGVRRRDVLKATGVMAAASAGSLLAADGPAHAASRDRVFKGNVLIRGPDPWADVRAYGAKGDGVTDDTDPIRAAISAARASGGTVLFPPTSESYLCSGSLHLDEIDRGLVLQGGPASLRFTGNAGNFITIRSSAGVRLRDLNIGYIDADYHDDLITTGHIRPQTADTGYLRIENCVLGGVGGAIGARSLVRLHQCITSYVRGCVLNAAAVGIIGVDPRPGDVEGSYSNAIQIENNTFSAHGLTTAAIKNAGDTWTISGNTFEPLRSFQAGGYLQDPNINSFALTFIGNWFGDGKEAGKNYISILGSVYGFAAINNRFAPTCGCDSTDASIQLGGGQGAAIIGNRFQTGIGVDLSIPFFLGIFFGGNDFQDQVPVRNLTTARQVSAIGNNNLPNYLGEAGHLLGVATPTPQYGVDVRESLGVSGDLAHSGFGLGFYGKTPTTKPSVSGAKSDNAALTSLVAALAQLGLVTDATT